MDRRVVITAWALGLWLFVLHVYPFAWSGDWAPGLPAELGYRLAWMGAAFAYLWWFGARIWARGEDE